MRAAGLAATLARWWARVYTRRLPQSVAADRRAELASDLWEHRTAAERAGAGSWSVATAILGRTLAGVPADLIWRTACLASTRDGVVRDGEALLAAGDPPLRRARSGGRTTRRAFLRRSLGLGSLGVLGGFGGATIGFLWPDLRGGFGGEIEAGPVDDILTAIRAQRSPYVVTAARAYLVEYDPALDPDGAYAAVTAGGASPVMALYWRCAHLGCRVPWCLSSQWLECPCHGSAYNRWGEWEDGPAPRGLDRFPVSVRDGVVVIDTGQVVTGPTRRSRALNQPREGLACVTLAAG